jgi:hypothetical protein
MGSIDFTVSYDSLSSLLLTLCHSTDTVSLFLDTRQKYIQELFLIRFGLQNNIRFC